MMKRFLSGVLLVFLSLQVSAAEKPLWMRYVSLSPDGSQIAFTYKGDIFKVQSTGGRAVQLTTHPAHDTRPIWSPDGSKIAFSSNREGGFDLYVMEATGGAPTRLTTHSANEYPVVFKDTNHILFSASIMPDVKDTQFPVFDQVYEVNVTGGRPSLFASLPMENISIHGNKMLYHNKKGYEDEWRKHHQSSIARDIWMADFSSGEKEFTKLSTFRGEERNPVWKSADSYYYLSEESGSFNVHKRDLNGGNQQQLTHFKEHPVRFLSSSKEGVLCFAYDGEIYTMKEGQEPQKVSISVVADNLEKEVEFLSLKSGVREFDLSPDEKEIAFVLRGDVFVSSIEYGTTKRITNTSEQERNVSFSPDGRSIIYASERGGVWNIYQTSLKRKEDKSFVYAQGGFEEEQLTKGEVASFEPQYSPDGKEVAFLENRTTIRVLNLKSKKSRTVLDGKYNYSYADGDQWFKWSPDSKWIVTKYIGVGGWNNIDVALVKADGSGELTNLTESGYSDGAPRFTQDGKAMLWISDRSGYRNHGSWGAQTDAYLMFFDQEAYDDFNKTKEEQEEFALLDKKEKKEKEKSEEKADDKKEKEKKKEKVKPLKFELEYRKDWTVRLTPASSYLVDAYLTNKRDKLYYITRFENTYDLWVYNFEDRSSKVLAQSVGYSGLLVSKDESTLYLLKSGMPVKVNMASGGQTPIAINAQFEYRPMEEREYIFSHIWKQVDDKFYDPELHGVDWPGYREAYQRFLPHVTNNYDFAELLSEFLGELNASHTGARYSGRGSSRPTASLGVFYDNEYVGEGVKIKEILKLGPLGKAKSKVREGSIITKIDGVEIKEGMDFYPLLAGKVAEQVLLTFKNGNKEYEEWVKPISYGAQRELLYKRWVDRCRAEVDRLSEGKLGYVHIRGMDGDSFREVYAELLGRSRNKEAVVIDTRFNGGGWLHDDLVTLLSGKEYQRYEPRGQYIGSDPYSKWLKPSVVLMSEANYSNAHGFPWLYKELKIGKLIGAPVPGTMTAVWWETQIDPSIVFGIPEVGVKDMRGNYLENLELFPDIEVYNDPKSTLEGEDKQLEKAVEYLLEHEVKN